MRLLDNLISMCYYQDKIIRLDKITLKQTKNNSPTTISAQFLLFILTLHCCLPFSKEIIKEIDFN